jgi:hypothetical protein
MKRIKGDEIVKSVIAEEFGIPPCKAELFQKINEQIQQKAQPKQRFAVKRVFAWQTMPMFLALFLVIVGGAMGLYLLSQQDDPHPNYTIASDDTSIGTIEPPTETASHNTTITTPTTTAPDSDLITPSETTTTGVPMGTPPTASPVNSTPAVPSVSTTPPTATTPLTARSITPTSPPTTSPPPATNSHGLPIMWVCDGCFRQNCRNEFPEYCGLKIRSCGYCNGLEIPTGFGLPCRCDDMPLEHLINYCMGCGKLTGENEIQECWPDPCNNGPLLYCHTFGILMENCDCHHCQVMRANS